MLVLMKIFGKDHRGQCFQLKVAEKMKQPEFYSTWIQHSLSALTSLLALIKPSSLFTAVLNAFLKHPKGTSTQKSHQNKPWTYLCLPFSSPVYILSHKMWNFPLQQRQRQQLLRTTACWGQPNSLGPAACSDPPQPWETRMADAAKKCGKGA